MWEGCLIGSFRDQESSYSGLCSSTISFCRVFVRVSVFRECEADRVRGDRMLLGRVFGAERIVLFRKELPCLPTTMFSISAWQ